MPRIEALLVVACLCHLKVYQWICSIVTAQEKKKQKEKKACDSSQPGTARTPDQKNTKAVSSPELNLEKKVKPNIEGGFDNRNFAREATNNQEGPKKSTRKEKYS